jgi:hypothetical protein
MTQGKGSVRRPAAVTEAEAVDRWAATFGQQLAKPDTTPDTASHDRARDERG